MTGSHETYPGGVAVATTTEADWLDQRRTKIGASEAATVLGINPYQTALELYYRKTGQLPPTPESLPMRLGKMMEPILCTLYEEDQGWIVDHKQEFVVSKQYPFMAATIDGAVLDEYGKPGTLVEFKTANIRRSEEWGETGTDEVPLQYLVQVQHQMIVTGLSLAHIAVLIGNADFRIYKVERHDRLCQQIIDREAEFWQAIESRKTPQERPEDAAVVARLAPVFEAEVDLSDNPEALADAMLYRQLSTEIKAKTEEQNLAKYRLIRSMAHHASAKLADGTILKRTTVKPKPYTVTPSEYVKFTMSKPKGD